MYEGNNPTALNSREWLVNALLSLMEELPYQKITVTNICTAADLSRQTFYNFFDSKDDIIRFCIQQCYMEMMENLNSKSPLHLNDITIQLSKTFQHNQKLMKMIIHQGLEHLLESELETVIHSFAKQMNPDIDNPSSEYGTAFLIGAIAHTVIYWFKDPHPISENELSELLSNILLGNYYRIQNS